jgi:hypothetical protein
MDTKEMILLCVEELKVLRAQFNKEYKSAYDYFNDKYFIYDNKHCFGKMLYVPNTELYHFKVRYKTEVARDVWRELASKKPHLMPFVVHNTSADGQYTTLGGCWPKYCGFKGAIMDAYAKVKEGASVS